MNVITMAYCPTMEPFAQEIENNLREVKIIPAYSAAQVLNMLRSGEVDSVLIGRTAKKSEINADTGCLRLKEGITLAYRTKAGIPVSRLREIEVVTYLEPERVEGVKDLFAEVIHLDTLNDCLKYNLEVPVLVDWQDYRDDFELLIPMNEGGKSPEFRAPVIYYSPNVDEEILQKITAAL